ncbi:MAG: VWA domain-containing protein [Thalassolituus oleivorans]|uniref:vWA domain-containing protein n=1 Tax=Thalassolituus oleivorans TaxID=187493 RepID=UPI001B494CCC|nr:VWA domain-containing protein [Thalassolituus oleivorans]MBQ0726364.1 VWA domain-containing protein [Thalassolituus oleivorans]MBQ0781160.1 VWA domain-containing protein [Thalassolituus oleivorans]
MLIDFFETVRRAKVPCSVREYLDLVNAIQAHVAFADMNEFYALARLCLVKDEKHYDKFDKAFGAYFQGLDSLPSMMEDAKIPAEWMRKEFERMLSKEEMDKIEALGGLDKLIEEFKKRLEEQHKRHQGGNKMIGTGGTSPFGANGYNPEGIRIDQGQSRHKKAIKVWEQRNYKDLDDSIELGTRNIKVALRRLRKFARQGAADELDLGDTISSTARNAGFLDIKMVPERHNAVKVLLFFDVGGSMDPHVRVCEELFSATRTEFKHMETFYFHNCLYESVWKNNIRRMNERTETWDILRKYGSDYRVIFVGDAMMAPYEVTHAGGSVEHWNEEPGAVWMQRMSDHYEKMVWLNPAPESHWGQGGSLGAIREIVKDKMYPLTLTGLENAMKFLSK